MMTSTIGIFTIISFLLVLSLAQDHVPPYGGVISLNMIHRDTPSSPLYNSSLTNRQRVRNALRRSRQRMNYFLSSEDGSPDDLMYSEGEYLVNISIGTPPKPFIGIVDTGSNLIWTQCLPCTECFKQYPPLFDPSSSSTYTALSCESHECSLLGEAAYRSTSNSCEYQYAYGDGSRTTGNLSLDTVKLDSTSIPDTIFGCGHLNEGIFSGIESGIVGLGRGAVSFISQLGDYLVGGKYFSYCLAPSPAMSFWSDTTTSPSMMYFGRHNTTTNSSAPEVLTTPLLSNDDSGTQTFYILELQGITVGANHITLDAEAAANKSTFKGNIIIDSGTTITYLPEELYNKFESAIREALADQITVKENPMGADRLCFLTIWDIVQGPNVTVHFNGADVKLEPANTYFRVDEETLCLAFSSSGGSVGIYGNLAQINYLVGYDLENMTVSFQPTDCKQS